MVPLWRLSVPVIRMLVRVVFFPFEGPSVAAGSLVSGLPGCSFFAGFAVTLVGVACIGEIDSGKVSIEI